MKVDLSPYKKALLNRRAQFSTVMVFKTDDPKRLTPFIHFIRNYYKSKNTEPRFYVYKVWQGLFELRFNINVQGQETLEYRPVSLMRSSTSRLAQAIQATSATTGIIRNLEVALQYLDGVLSSQKNVVVIFWGLFQKNESLIAFLRSAIFTDEYYDKGHMIVIFSEDPHSIIDDSTLQYTIYIPIPPSTNEERRAIIQEIAESAGLKATNGYESLINATRGLNLHQTESVVLKSIYQYGTLDPKAMTELKYDLIQKSGILDIEEPEHGFEAVGGYDPLKQFVQYNVIKVIKNPRKAYKLGLRPPRGLLLFGPPGTGKTWFARALAKELDLPFLRLRTEKIVSRFYGETTRLMSKALQLAENVAPCILFIDEIDRFGQRGGITEHEESRRAFSVLLEWLGDTRRKTIIIGTTNRPEDLDEAFIRVGRFDYVIPVILPDLEAREQILNVHTSIVRKVPLKNVDLHKVAELTEFWSGSELEELVIRAARNAFKEDREFVTMQDFERALNTFSINMDQRREQLQRYLALAEEFCNDAEFLSTLTSSTSRKDAFLRELENR